MSDCGCGCKDCTDGVNFYLDMAMASKLCATAQFIKTLEITASKNGPVEGNLYVSIVRDNQGIPSTESKDILFKSKPQAVSGFQEVMIDYVLLIPVGISVESPETCHVVVETDDEYRKSIPATKANAFIKCTAKTKSPCKLDTLNDGWHNTSFGPIVKVTGE